MKAFLHKGWARCFAFIHARSHSPKQEVEWGRIPALAHSLSPTRKETALHEKDGVFEHDNDKCLAALGHALLHLQLGAKLAKFV